MMQSMQVNILGVIGHISSNEGKGQTITVYVNKLDRFGQFEEAMKIRVAVFNDAERLFTRSNAKVGDTIIIQDGSLSIRNINNVTQVSVSCSWYRQIIVIAAGNQQTLLNRNPVTSA